MPACHFAPERDELFTIAVLGLRALLVADQGRFRYLDLPLDVVERIARTLEIVKQPEPIDANVSG